MTPIFSQFLLLCSAWMLPFTSRPWISEEAEDEDIHHPSDVLNKPWIYRQHISHEMNNTFLFSEVWTIPPPPQHFQPRKRNKNISLFNIPKPASVSGVELGGKGGGAIQSWDAITSLSFLSTEEDGRRGFSWRSLFINPAGAQEPSSGSGLYHFLNASRFVLSRSAK